MYQQAIKYLAYVSQTYEVVAASVIIISTLVVLILLYRNLRNEFRKAKEERMLMKRENDLIHREEKTRVDKLVDQNKISKKSKDILGLINQEIRHAKEGNISVLYYMNLDNFRYIVEKYTQKDVDRVVLEIEKRLRKTHQKQSVCGHLQEDVFLCYISGKIDNDIIKQVAESLLKIVAEPLRSVKETLTTSIGVVLFPYDGITAEQLIKNAEIALYVSKKEGKNRYALYSEDLIEKEQYNMNYYQEIKRSISRDEFLLYYQPIVDIKTGKLIGLESLLRWNHPTMGILSPGKFLNVMDLTGDITWFGTWGFEKIVSQFVQWRKTIRIKDLFISTNLSPKQLMVENLAKSFYDIIQKYEVQADDFCLEILDYYTIVKSPSAIHNLSEFRKYGFRIAVDDLGDEYEIMTDLDHIKANIIKISREEILKVMNDFPESDSIIRIIQLAKQRQKVIIAEGIEDENMIKKMASIDVRFLQGYYFAQPKSIEEMTEMLKKSPWDMNSFDRFFN